MNRTAPATLRRRLIMTGSLTAAAALAFTGCASGGGSSSGDSGSDDTVGVSLIVKTTSNPFFVAMEDGAKDAADKLGVDLTLAAGKEDGDEDTQIQAIENAISKGDAGLFVIALDTPPGDPEAVDITVATDNFLAGEDIGEWTAAKLAGEKATIAMIDLFDDKVVSVDVARDQGFLDGMGIDLADETKNGDEASTGSYSGGEYEIVGNEASQGAEDGGRTAAETLLSKNPDINVVYTINEPAAYGAFEAFKAAGATDDLIVVSVDGGCAGIDAVKEGIIGATSQQYPVKMAELGVQAIFDLVETGEVPENSAGLDFFNTGVALVTDDPQDGVESIDTAEGGEICWG